MITRSQWGARTPANPLSSLTSTRGVKIHYTGGRVDPATLTDHAKCVAAVKGIQNGHMNGNGWSDIGYSMVACAHDYFVGRGPNKLPAANGAGLNSQHYAVLVLVGNSGVVSPTEDHLRQAWRAIDYLRAHGEAGPEIKGHRDGYATDCPGELLYALVRHGFPRPGTAPPEDPPQPLPPSGDDMTPQYFSYGSSDSNEIDVLPGTAWTRVTWDTEYADPSGEHSGVGYTMLKGDPSVYVGDWFVEFADVPEGTVVEMRVSELLYDNTQTPPADVMKEAGWPSTSVLSESMTASLSDTGSVSENRKLVLEVRHDSSSLGKIVGARAKLLAWQ